MCKVLVIDNYDSFTYNLVHLLEGLDAKVTIVRNDKLNTIVPENYTHILISPGPGLPNEIKQVSEFIQPLFKSHSILGVCMGHQIIGEMFNANLYQNDVVYHGVALPIIVNKNSKLFKGLPSQFNVGRYHSWMIKNLPNELVVMATDEENQIMAFEHKELNIFGIQFHPESILSEYGSEVMRNWLTL